MAEKWLPSDTVPHVPTAFHAPAREVTQHAEAQDREQGVAGSSSASTLHLKDPLLAPGTQHSVPSVQGGPGSRWRSQKYSRDDLTA